LAKFSNFGKDYNIFPKSKIWQNVQNFAKYEQAICDKMIDIYANVCVNGKFFKEKYNNNTSSVKKYLQRKLKHGDWYMTAAETVSYGLADKVIKSL